MEFIFMLGMNKVTKLIFACCYPIITIWITMPPVVTLLWGQHCNTGIAHGWMFGSGLPSHPLLSGSVEAVMLASFLFTFKAVSSRSLFPCKIPNRFQISSSELVCTESTEHLNGHIYDWLFQYILIVTNALEPLASMTFSLSPVQSMWSFSEPCFWRCSTF